MFRELKRPRKEKTPTPRIKRVLVLAKDDLIGLWMVRSLGMNGLTVFSVCQTALGLAGKSRYSSGAWYGNVDTPSESDIDQVASLAKQLDVGSIMPLSEQCHLALIQRRSDFEPDIHLFCPPAEALDKAADKDFMHGLCVDLGIPVARGMTFDKLMRDGGEGLRFPVVLRTRRQLGSDVKPPAPWGRVAYAHDVPALRVLSEEVAGFADNIIAQEFHPGATDQAQVVMHDGKAFTCQFLAETHLPLAGGVSVRRITFRQEALIDDAVRLLRAIGWEGAAGVQFHYDHRTDTYIFMEINPRFVGGIPTMVRAGYHGPFLLWQSRFEPDQMKQPTWVTGLRSQSLRTSAYWLAAVVGNAPIPPGDKRKTLRAIASFLWHCGPWTREDSFLLSDPGPFFLDCRKMLPSVRFKR